MAHNHGGSESHSRNVALASAITVAFMLVEATVGFFTGSLVLIAGCGPHARRCGRALVNADRPLNPCFPEQTPCYADDASPRAMKRAES